MRIYLAKYSLPIDTQPLGMLWLAVCKGTEIALTLGFTPRPDGSLEVTDFYAVPSRTGIEAAYYTLGFLKALVDSEKIPYIVASAFAKNRSSRIRFKRIFGVEPVVVVYRYPEAIV